MFLGKKCKHVNQTRVIGPHRGLPAPLTSRFPGSPGRRFVGSTVHRFAGSPVPGSPVRRFAGSPVRRFTGSLVRRFNGSEGRINWFEPRVRTWPSRKVPETAGSNSSSPVRPPVRRFGLLWSSLWTTWQAEFDRLSEACQRAETLKADNHDAVWDYLRCQIL